MSQMTLSKEVKRERERGKKNREREREKKKRLRRAVRKANKCKLRTLSGAKPVIDLREALVNILEKLCAWPYATKQLGRQQNAKYAM